MNKLNSTPDHKFENTMLQADNAALRKELENSREAQQTASRKVVELAPLAEMAKKLERENGELKEAAKAAAKAVADGKKAVTQWGIWEGNYNQLNDRFTTLEKERNEESNAVIRLSGEADKFEKLAAAHEGKIKSLEQAERVQERKIREFKYSFFGTAGLLLLTVMFGIMIQEQLTRAPEEISTEASADWQKHSAEYRQIFKIALARETERIRAEERSAAFFTSDNRSWGFWDIVWALGFGAVGAVVGAIFFGWLIKNLFW